MKTKKLRCGMSLIVLVITVVVIIILALAVILVLNKNSPIENAKEAKFKSDLKSIAEITEANLIAESMKDKNIINGIIKDKATLYKLVPELEKSKYRAYISDGQLAISDDPDDKDFGGYSEKQIKWAQDIDVLVKSLTIIYTDTDGNKAPIPEGFVVSSDENEDTIAKGLVIKQGYDPASTDSNEFVWVPVKDPATEYKRGVNGQETLDTNFTENDSDQTNIDIQKSVNKYKGFYIGRYETGLSDNAEYSDSNSDGTFWIDATPVVKKGARPWNAISRKKAIDVSKSLVVNKASVKSTLINSYMWDTTLNYIISSKAKSPIEVISDSTDWGNYVNAIFTPISSALYSTDWCYYTKVTENKEKPSGKRWLLTTGATNRNSVKNIYDLAGNLWEWTTENYNGSGSASCRGGLGYESGSASPAERRVTCSPAVVNDRAGFRVVLYLL